MLNRRTQIAMIACVGALFLSCKKTAGSTNNNGNGGGNGGTDTTVTITPPHENPLAATIGFYGDDWTGKTFTVPAFIAGNKPTVTADATVSVDMSDIVTKVSKYLFGNNSVPYMTQMVTEPVLMDQIKNLSPNIIRFPGGNISSVYFWNSAGTPPADAPAKLLDATGASVDPGYWYGNNTASWTLTLDNYYTMLQQTNNTGIITVNYAYARYSTAANPVAAAAHLAADWVRYDKGRTKYWEIGNESNGTWQAGYEIDVSQNHDGQPQLITGTLYGQHFKVFADSMHAAAAETGAVIKIGAQLLDAAPQSWQTATDQTWNQGVFAAAGSTPDYYIVHDYYTPYNTNSNATDILATAAAVTKNIMTYYKSQVTQNAAAIKPLALTEWNIFATGSKQMVSHIAGMHAVMTLGELMQNQFGEASRWDLANGWSNGDDMGMFNNGDEPGAAKWQPRPAFYHMYYMQKYFGDRMVNSSVTGSGDVTAYASSWSSGQSGVVVANTGTADKTVTITIKNFKPGTNYYWYTLTGGNDNGEFSRKVYINGIGPAGDSGGPADYATVKAYQATVQGGIIIKAPARSISFLVVDNQK